MDNSDVITGKLHQLEPANQEEHFVSGEQLLTQVKELARKQVFRNSALCYCYRYPILTNDRNFSWM